VTAVPKSGLSGHDDIFGFLLLVWMIAMGVLMLRLAGGRADRLGLLAPLEFPRQYRFIINHNRMKCAPADPAIGFDKYRARKRQEARDRPELLAGMGCKG
jgi:hypothetical protein